MINLFGPSPQSSDEEEAILQRFERRGGSLPLREVEQYIDHIPLQSHEREYVKAVMAKFDNPHEPAHKRYITQEEFLQGIDDMIRNNRDSISPDEAERIKEYFSK